MSTRLQSTSARDFSYENPSSRNTVCERHGNKVVICGSRPDAKYLDRKYNADGDSVQIKNSKFEQEEKKARARQNRIKRAWANRFLGAMMAVTVMVGGGKVADKMAPTAPNFDCVGHTITEVAEWTDVDYRAILLANHLTDEDEQVESIILPERYSVYGSQIEKLEDRLENKKLKDSEREEIEEELESLREKQAYIDEFAQVYTDEEGKYVYIIPNERYCSAEKLKDIFGIKDGVLRNNNDLSYSWGSNEYGGYKDYTGSCVPYSGIKVPVKELFKDK